MADTCQERLAPIDQYESFRPRRCGRPVVKDGLCSRHLAVKARRERKAAEWREGYDRRQADNESLRTLNIDAQCDPTRDGYFIISRADLLKLLGKDRL